MKSDLEKFIELYKSVGIELEPSTETFEGVTMQTLTLTVGDAANIGGYSEFYTEINFDTEGKFLEQNTWE